MKALSLQLLLVAALPKRSNSLPLLHWPKKIITRLRSSSATDGTSLEEVQLDLDTGVSMKVTSQQPWLRRSKNNKEEKPVLLFLHGSFHGGWCWTEHFFPYFVNKGYSVVAPCWRGTGGTFAGEGVKKVKIAEHVADLESLLDQLPSVLGRTQGEEIKPVVIAHSFGSLAVMKMLEWHPERAQQLSGIVMFCGVPPSGNGKLTMRYLRRSLVDSYKITAGLAMKKCLTDATLCRELFWGGPKVTLPDGTIDDKGLSDDDVARYQAYLARDSEAVINLFDLGKQLPSFTTIEKGKAAFYTDLPPCMVFGATNDFIVDKEAVEETARYFNVDAPHFIDAPHDVMLGSTWKNAAQGLDEWLDNLNQKGRILRFF